MSAKLVFLSGSRAGHQIELGEIPVSLGRSPDCTITYPSGQVLVSARHATVSPLDDGYLITDEQSRNGTFVNKRRVSDHALSNGDVVELGPGGPSLQFTSLTAVEVQPTLEVGAITLSSIYRAARDRTDMANTGTFERPLHLSREFVSIAYKKTSRRTRIAVAVLAVALAVSTGTLVRWNLQTRAAMQSVLDEMAVSLAQERVTRTTLARDLAAIEGANDSLRTLFDNVPASAPEEALGTVVTRDFSAGVALIVYAYGFSDKDSGRMLRYRTDGLGGVLTSITPGGDTIPQLTLRGNGPLVERTGSATGFLIDQRGWMVTNRHVAVPWIDDAEVARMKKDGLPIEPLLTVLRAHFPPGNRTYQLVVDRVSEDHDLALLRSITPGVDAPVLPLAPPDFDVDPGEPVVLIGYPTGVHNLMFRVTSAVREDIAHAVGNNASPIRLATELAERGLIQPLVTSGNVADTTSGEIIHSAESTGGSSGGPLIDASRRVIAVHYAYVSSPVDGDPFRTQRGVRVNFLWELLPDSLRARLTN